VAYLHCHSCDWEQDDFWEPGGYNPFRDDKIEWLRECLWSPKMRFDGGFYADHPELPVYADEEGEYVRGQDVAALELRRMEQQVSNMAVPTFEDWKRVRETFKCPRCGAQNWDID